MCAWEIKHMCVKGIGCETADGTELYWNRTIDTKEILNMLQQKLIN
jgi:hypothetical protein